MVDTLAYVEPGSAGPLSEGTFLALWIGGFLFLAVTIAIMGVTAPERIRYGRRYGPETPELTEDRVRSVVFWTRFWAVALAGVAMCGLLMPAGRPLDARGVDSGAREAAYDLAGRDDHLFGEPNLTGVQNALDDAAGDGRLRATETGENSYTITNSDGKHPVCLTVTPGRRDPDTYDYGKPTTFVTTGRC